VKKAIATGLMVLATMSASCHQAQAQTRHCYTWNDPHASGQQWFWTSWPSAQVHRVSADKCQS
jgi:hypothetical protein